MKIPDHVEEKAGVSAGKGLYHKVPGYPWLDTSLLDLPMGVMVLHPDGKDFILDNFGIDIGDAMMIKVVPSDVPSWDEDTMTLYANIPLFSATFW